MSPKILVLDVERVPSWTKPLAFWSPKDLQHKYLGADDVAEWGRTICLAYQWYGERQVHFIAEWQEGGREGYLAKAKGLLEECDVLSGHNSKFFDFPHLQGDLIMAGLGAVPEPKHIDTLLIARKKANWEMNHLAVLTQRLGIPTKNDKYRIDVAMGAAAGDVKLQRRIERYNKGDVRASTGMLTKFLPISGVNLGVFVDSERPTCSRCTSAKLQRRGYATTTAGRYPRFQCQSCGGWSKGKGLLRPEDGGLPKGTTELRPI